MRLDISFCAEETRNISYKFKIHNHFMFFYINFVYHSIAESD